MALKDYAREVFKEVNKTRGKKKHGNFIKYYKQLYDKILEEQNENNVGCEISNDCSVAGCYRYCICNFIEKKV